MMITVSSTVITQEPSVKQGKSMAGRTCLSRPDSQCSPEENLPNDPETKPFTFVSCETLLDVKPYLVEREETILVNHALDQTQEGDVSSCNKKHSFTKSKNSRSKCFHCSECEKSFLHKSSLVTHQITHSGIKPFSCNSCEKSFFRKAHLITHERTHTGVKPFKCHECGKCFVEKSNLILHQQNHSGFKPFSCGFCEKSFFKKSILVDHQRTHSGVKSFKCDTCSKCFFRKSHLLDHQRTHTGVKPFNCQECGKGFIQKSNLVTHQRSHTGVDPKCRTCFIDKSSLVHHQCPHLGMKIFSCNDCDKHFTKKAHLLNHQISTHPMLKPFCCNFEELQ